MGRKALSVTIAGLSALPPSARKAALYAAAVRRAFAREKSKASGQIAVVFLPRTRMRTLNRRYLGHDWDTDVIAFQHEPTPSAPVSENPLGDICVSAWMARRQARELKHTVLRESLILVTHGALHLLGHADSSRAARNRMFRLQDQIVSELGA